MRQRVLQQAAIAEPVADDALERLILGAERDDAARRDLFAMALDDAARLIGVRGVHRDAQLVEREGKRRA